MPYINGENIMGISNIILGSNVGKITDEGGEIFNSYEGDDLNQALDIGAHAEGRQTIAGKNAHAEGRNTQANGNASHAEGNHSVANGNFGAHAEGRETLANADAAHAEGQSTKALGKNSHAEGEMSTAQGDKSHSEGTKTIAIGNSSHSQGRECVAGTKAFEITAIDFTPKEEEPEEDVGAVVTYYVGSKGKDTNDGLSTETQVLTIAKAVELANNGGYVEGDVVSIILDAGAVDIGTLPPYKFDLVVESKASGRSIAFVGSSRMIANNEGHLTMYKNVDIRIETQYSNIQMCGSNVVFDKKCVISGAYPTLTFGTGTDNGSPKEVAGQKVVINSKTAPYISLSNFSYAAKTYTEDVELELNSSDISAKIVFNAYYSGKTNGTTKFNKNVNLNIKEVQTLSFDYLDGVTFKGAVQIINSSSNFPIVPWMPGLERINAPMWVLTNQSANDDVLTFTEVAGVYKVKDGYIVSATNDLGDEIVSKEGVLDLSKTDGMYSFEIKEETVFEGSITLTSSTGLEPEMLVSIKSNSNQDFLLNAGIIKSIENNVLKIEGYPSQINRFLSSGKNYLFILANATLGDVELGDSSNANGTRTKAIGNSSYANGEGTIAVGNAQYVCGTYNANKPNTVFELGCGTSENNRANAFEVYKDGTISIYGTKITRTNLRKLLEMII